MNYVIREAATHDIAFIPLYLPALTGSTFGHEQPHEKLPGRWLGLGPLPPQLSMNEMNHNTLCLVAEAEARLIGIILWRGGRFSHNSHVSTLVALYVDESWRNQGIGGALLKSSMDWASSSDMVRRLHAEIPVYDTGLISLLENYGFSLEGRLSSSLSIDGKPTDGVILAHLV